MSNNYDDIENGVKELEKKFNTEYAIYFSYNINNILKEVTRRSSYMDKDKADKYIKTMTELVMVQYDIDKAEEKIDEYSAKILEARSKKRINKKLIEKYKFERSIFEDYVSLQIKLLERFNLLMGNGGVTIMPEDEFNITFDIDDEDPIM